MSETKIEPGTYWKARDGVKVFVVGRTQAGKVVIKRCSDVDTLDAAGRMFAYEPHSWDLVAPWTEPRKFKLWVYDNGRHFNAYEFEQIGSTPIAIVEVTEGDGLKEQP